MFTAAQKHDAFMAAVKTAVLERRKVAALPTVGLDVKDIASNVDILKHLGGATGKHVEDLAHHYKNWHLSPSFAKGQAQLAQAVAKPVAPVAAVAQAATKRTPTVGVGHGVQALQGIQGAVQHGAPVRATPEVLAALGQMPGHALGFSGKYAGIQVRGYVRRPAHTARGKIKKASLLELVRIYAS